MASEFGAADSEKGFDFTQAMRLLCADMVERLPQLKHVDLTQVVVSFSQARRNQPHGLQATLTPLRFESGAMATKRRGRSYGLERLYDDSGKEYLYILSFYLPRFLNHGLEEKLTTVLHELWHISPEFNGDLRRFAGRCYAHGPSQRRYDEQVAVLARQWRASSPPDKLYAFLRLTFAELQQKYGRIYGVKMRTPKLIPLND